MAVSAPTPAQSTAIQGVGSAFASGAPAGLTPAQQTAVKGVQQAFAPAAPIAPPPSPVSGSTGASEKTTEPTVMSSSNVDQKNQQNVQTATTAATIPKGQTIGTEGFVKNADQSFAEAPSGATQVTDASGNNYWTSNGMNYAIGPTGGKVSSDPYIQGIYDQFTTLKSQMDATGAAQIQAIKDSYDALIQLQQQANAGAEAGVTSLLMRGGSMQTASSSGIVHAQVSAGLMKIGQLTAQENSAIAAAQQAIQANDMKVLDTQLSIADKAHTDAQTAAQKLNDSIVAATAQATKDNAVANALKTTPALANDPAALLTELHSQGYDNISAKDVADSIANLDPTQKQVMALMQTASENGAPQDVITAIGNAKTFTDALTAGSNWISTNPNVQQYNVYRSQQLASGKPAASFDTWMSSQAYKKAFATAKGTLAGQMGAIGGTSTNPNDAIPSTPTDTQTANTVGGSILQATGLSLFAFNYLTQGTSALSRLSQGQRYMVEQEATNFANSKGVDVSTLQSQFKALNDVLASNVARENNAYIKGNDVTQSVDQLISAITPADEAAMTNHGFFGIGSSALSLQNIVELAAGKQVNNPQAVKYGTGIELLVNDLAGYLAATRSSSPTGAATPDQQDTQDAAQMVYDGMNTGSLSAFQSYLQGNVDKIANVSKKAADNARQQVWQLMGVGDQFQSSQPQNSPQVKNEEQAITQLQTFGSASTQNYNLLQSLKQQFPNASASDIISQLQANGIDLTATSTP